MVGAHGARGVGHADALDRPRVVGRHGLALDDGDPLDAEDPAGHAGAVAQDAAQGGALAHFLDEIDGRLGVPEVAKPGLHGHPDGRAHLDGVQAEVVIQTIHHGDGVEVVDAAVGAVGPDRLVLGLLGQVMAVLVVVDPRAPDDAAPVAAVGGEPPRAVLRLRLGLAADLVVPSKRPQRKLLVG